MLNKLILFYVIIYLCLLQYIKIVPYSASVMSPEQIIKAISDIAKRKRENHAVFIVEFRACRNQVTVFFLMQWSITVHM
jgi:hypothetical protein